MSQDIEVKLVLISDSEVGGAGDGLDEQIKTKRGEFIEDKINNYTEILNKLQPKSFSQMLKNIPDVLPTGLISKAWGKIASGFMGLGQIGWAGTGVLSLSAGSMLSKFMVDLAQKGYDGIGDALDNIFGQMNMQEIKTFSESAVTMASKSGKTTEEIDRYNLQAELTYIGIKDTKDKIDENNKNLGIDIESIKQEFDNLAIYFNEEAGKIK